MSAVGLTKAMRAALEKWSSGRIWPGDRMVTKLVSLKLFDEVSLGDIPPRAYAALAAPRMTQAELEMLERLTTRQLHCELSQRVLRKLRAKGYCESTSAMTEWITDAGLKALNDVRAATGSELYKDNMP